MRVSCRERWSLEKVGKSMGKDCDKVGDRARVEYLYGRRRANFSLPCAGRCAYGRSDLAARLMMSAK